MLSLAMLGIYEEGPVEGGCKAGADFICGPKGGVESCRPCDFAQLEMFQALQKEANNLATAFGFDMTPTIVTAPNGASGGYALAVDGRIGPATLRTVNAVIKKARNNVGSVSSPAEFLPGAFEATNRYVARFAEEALSYLAAVATAMKAPKNVPAPAEQPIVPQTATESRPVVIPVLPESVTQDQESLVVPAPAPLPSAALPKKTSGTKVAVAVLAGIATVGLVGTGVYYYRQRG